VNPEIVLEALREVVDPELGVNVVDLGLVRAIACEAGGVQVKMTLTTPGCPLHASLSGAVDQAIRLMVPGISDVEVELVWDPP
jgi:metal-sulfur cluster biosynthetic enzyme